MTHPEPISEHWMREHPPMLVPIPAAEETVIAGRRLILYDARARAWRHDLRAATNVHSHRGQRLVGVVDEAAWYRQQRAAAHVVPSPIPVEQLWVEQQLEDVTGAPERPDLSGLPAEFQRLPQVVDPSRPPIRHLRPATGVKSIVGQRACVMTREGPTWDHRVCSEAFVGEWAGWINATDLDTLGDPMIGPLARVCSEAEYYGWVDDGTLASARSVPLPLVWLE